MRRENQSFPDVPSVAMALTPSYPVHCMRPAVLQENARRFVTGYRKNLMIVIRKSIDMDNEVRWSKFQAVVSGTQIATLVDQERRRRACPPIPLHPRCLEQKATDLVWRLVMGVQSGIGKGVDLVRREPLA